MTHKHFDRHGNEYKIYLLEGKAHSDTYYFEIYDDSDIEVKVIERGDGILKKLWVVIVVGGSAYLMHQCKFEAGRPHLRKNVEALAETLRGIRQSFIRDTALSMQVANPDDIEDTLG